MLFVLPAIMYVLVFTSSFHQLFFTNFNLSQEYGIPIFSFKLNIGIIIKNGYAYLLILFTFGVLIKSLFSKNGNSRKQMALFMIGVFIPIFYDALYQLGLSPLKNYNLSPVFISIGNCFIAWSILGYQFFKILSVARDLIIDNMTDVMIITDNENMVIDINKSGEQLFGIKKSNALNHSFYEVFKDYQGLTNCFTNRTDIGEISILNQDQNCHYSVIISKFSSESKETLANITLLHNITERKNADNQIKKLSVAIEQSPVIIVIADIEGNIEFVNPAFCKVTGYSFEEAMGSNPRVLKGNTPPETYVNLWETVLSGQVWHGEFINKKKSGEIYYEEATIAPIKNDKNEIINFIAIKSDISQRKKSEERLKISEDNLKLAQSIGNVGHWEYNNVTKELFWSEQMYRIYEVSPFDYKPSYERVVALFHPEERAIVEEAIHLSLKNRTEFDMQHRIVTPAGKIKYINERSYTKYDENGNAINTIGSVADITSLKQVEEELNQEKALLRSLIDSIPDYIFVKDLDGTYTLANNSIRKFFGQAWQTVVGKTDYDFVDADTAKFFLEKDRIVIESGKSNTNEELVTYPDGERVWLETTKTPFKGLDGQYKGIIGVSREINERKQNEEALRTGRANLLALVENTNDNIWAIDTSYRMVFINNQFRNAFFMRFGINLLPGMNIIDALPQSVSEVWIPRYNRAMAGERFVFEEHAENENMHYYFDVSMNPIVVDSKVIGVSVFSRDITERKRVENQLIGKNDEIEAQNEELQQLIEELKMTNEALYLAKDQAEESEELFKQLLHHSPIYINIKDLNHRVVRLSNNYQKLLGNPIPEIISKTFSKFWPTDYIKKVEEEDLVVLNTGNLIESEDVINGKTYTSIKFPIYLEGKIRYVASFTMDITERKMAENKIQNQNLTLKELNATKDKFFSIIAHDLRSPFNAILGFSDYLVNNIELCSPEEISLFANNINTSATETYKLLENLLEWSKIQGGLVNPDFQTHNLSNILMGMQSLMTDNSKSKSISLQNNVDNYLSIYCDLEMTKTIFRNLISNAIKFTRENGIITINALIKKPFVEIEIKDTGVGIPAEIIPHLFSIEKNTSTKGTEDESGTGLGLILCKELVENQGGKIWAESTEGQGSTFYFTLFQTKP